MSLLSDPDFLIHSIRLNYLRNVDDPYGPRIIALDPAYHSNPYTVAAGLADVDRWPELAMPSSPAPSDDEAAPSARAHRHAPFPGASGLKYTTTIMGPSRVGAVGLNVSRKRASVSKNSYRFSMRAGAAADAGRVGEGQVADGASSPPPAPVSTSPSKPDAPEEPQGLHNGAGVANGGERETSPEFVPKFKGAAEMEARRRLRMMARGGGGGPRPSAPPATLNPELSSSDSSPEEEEEGDDDDDDDDDIMPDEDDEDFDLVADADDSMEIDGDEFDPEFAASRGGGLHSDSDGASLLSGTNSGVSMSMSMSNSSARASSLLRSGSARVRNRLSPVRETQHGEESRLPPDIALERPEESAPIAGFEMVTAAPAPVPLPVPAVSVSAPEDLFARRPVPTAGIARSALSAMLATAGAGTSSNPFAELYSAISGRNEGESMSVQVFFPMARKSGGQALELLVRKDATVEEVLGFALWRYWEDAWLPKLDEGLEGEEDPKWETRCSAVGWILRIAEEDGEVDEDFPPPDRTGKISKFNFGAYAVLEATAAQVQQNKILESKIQRRLSRIVVKKKKSTGLLNATGAGTGGGLLPPADSLLGTSAGLGSLGSSLGMFPSSLGPSSSHGPPMFLRIQIAESDTAAAGHFSTTIQASGGMYMAEVLEAVCQKRKLGDPKDYALILDIPMPALPVYIPLDRTVKSLQGKRDLRLVRQDTLPVDIGQGAGRTTDPNASIFKRNSELPEQGFSSMLDYTNAYRKYTVYRKMPMLVTRNERLLAIDGGYIHIIPMSNKAKHVFDSGKTPSFHLSSVVACQQSRKNSATFKLVVMSDAERTKRYDFEAENPKMANEIVQTIRTLKLAMEKPSGSRQARRSRHVS